jgi:hypothetical protein
MGPVYENPIQGPKWHFHRDGSTEIHADNIGQLKMVDLQEIIERREQLDANWPEQIEVENK